MLLSFDVAPEAVAEHDDWHTHEHLPERLAIPGFLRGTRWVALRGQPRYLVLYEVADHGVLTSEPYLARLNGPSPWTTKMMAHYRGMRRGFCAVTGSFGLGSGHSGLLVRFEPRPEQAGPLRQWLLAEVLPHLPARPGVGSAHLLEGATTPPMTSEQRIRGADAGIGWAVFVSGYRAEVLNELARGSLARAPMESRGAADRVDALYRLDYSLSHDETVPREA